MSTELRLKDFIDVDLKVFSNLDNVRSIPSLIDGFKDSQRKAIFGALKSGSKEIKVAQLGSYASMVSHYAHGEVSMCDTISNLAQNFPGSNNVNLLEPIGQFGSILSPEPSSPRYIYTKPSAAMRKYLKPDDDLILEHRSEEGETYEPISYYPLLPMWIVNGVVGIGTGHSVKILSRDPVKVAEVVKKLVAGVNVQQRTIDAAMTPHFNGWKGVVVKGDSDTQWELHGVVEKVNTTTIRITELPITYDVDKFKAILIALMDAGKVKDFDNNSNDSGFDFVVNVPREVGRKTTDELKAIFKLVVKVGENVTLWDADNKLVRYDNVWAALQAFVEFRKAVYDKRKAAKLAVLRETRDWLDNRIAFTTYWNTKLVEPHKKNRKALTAEFDGVVDLKYFDRLLSLQISSLTMEKVEELKVERESIEADIKELNETSIEALYLKDLGAI